MKVVKESNPLDTGFARKEKEKGAWVNQARKLEEKEEKNKLKKKIGGVDFGNTTSRHMCKGRKIKKKKT